MDVAQSVHEARGLSRDGSTDSRITVTGVRDAEGCRAIDVLVTVGIGDGCAVCRLPEDGKILGEIGNVALLVASQLGGKRETPWPRDVHVSSPIHRTNSAMRGLPP